MPGKATRKPARRPAKRVGPAQTARLTDKQLQARLAEAARIGSLFIEGEDCANALTPAARQWTNADDINFDAAVAVGLKKTLLRIEQIERFPYYAVLWRRRLEDPGLVEVLLAGRRNSWFDPGKGKCLPMFPALRRAFLQGRPACVTLSRPELDKALLVWGHAWMVRHDSLLRAGGRIVSCFQPIRDSREQVVAALELTTAGIDT